MYQLPVDREEPGLAVSVWRYGWVVALAVLLGALGGWTWSTRQPVRYEAVAVVLLKDPTITNPLQDGAPPVDVERYVRNQAAFMTSPPVLNRAVKHVHGRVSATQLRRVLQAEPSKDLDLISVRVRDATARGAVQLANAVARSYEEVAVSRAKAATATAIKELDGTEKSLRDRLRTLQRAIRAIRDDQDLRAERDAASGQLTRVLEKTQELELQSKTADPVALQVAAEPPDEPVEPRPLLLVAGGAFLAFAASAGLAWRLNWKRASRGQPASAPQATEEAGRELERQGAGGPLRRARRLGRVTQLVTANGSPTKNGRKDNITITDFERTAFTIQQLFQNLEGPGLQLYAGDLPQLAAEEIARRFEVDLAIVLLDSGDEVQATGSVGLGEPQRKMLTERLHDLVGEAVETGPRLLDDGAASRLGSGLLGEQGESLALVPIVHHNVGFGALLTGRWGRGQPATPFSEREIEEMESCIQDLGSYLWTWVLVQNLRARLATLH